MRSFDTATLPHRCRRGASTPSVTFNRLFESIGLAVWQHGGGRSTTLAQVAEVARLEKLDTVLPIFQEGAEKGALALLTAFFFRRAGSDETFELTHKTFGEYLAARRLARLVSDLHRLIPQGDIDAAEGLRRWYRLTYAARVTLEILAFLEDELGALTLEEMKARRDTLISLFDENLASGMPYQGVDGQGQPKTYREAERFTAAAELALFSAIGVCTRVMIEKTEGLAPEERRRAVGWSPGWPDRDQEQRTSAWDLLRRLESGTTHDVCARSYMQGIDLDHQILRGDLRYMGWAFASTRFAGFAGTKLMGANLFGACLFAAELSFADLTDAMLRCAELSEATLFAAELRGADLANACVDGTNFDSADLRGAIRLTRRQLKAAKNVDWEKVPFYMSDDS